MREMARVGFRHEVHVCKKQLEAMMSRSVLQMPCKIHHAKEIGVHLVGCVAIGVQRCQGIMALQMSIEAEVRRALGPAAQVEVDEMRRVCEVRRVLRMVLLVAVVSLFLQSLLSFFIVDVALTCVDGFTAV